MQNAPVPSSDASPVPPARPGHQLFLVPAAPPRPPAQPRSITIPMSRRNLIVAGVAGLLLLLLAAIAIAHS